MDEMLAEQAAIEAAPPKSLLQLLWDRTVRWQLTTMAVIYCCNQLSGMSAVRTEYLYSERTCVVPTTLSKITQHFVSFPDQYLLF